MKIIYVFIFVSLIFVSQTDAQKGKSTRPNSSTSTETTDKKDNVVSKKRNLNADYEVGALKVTDESYIQNLDTIPARIELYSGEGGHYSYLKPIDLDTYIYMSFHPLTAYLFCVNMDEDKIRNLTIKNLKSISFSNFTPGSSSTLPYSLYYIKGFEDYAKELSKMDEFQIQEKKDIYINKLIECYQNYNLEFENKYLNNLYYIIGGTEILEENSNFKWHGKNAVRYVYPPLFITLSKDKYNFDKQTFEIEVPFFGYEYGTNWSLDRSLEGVYHKFRGAEFVNLNIPASTFKGFVDSYYSGLYRFTVKPTRNITYSTYGGGYYISLLDFKALDILITSGYTEYPVDQIWIKKAVEHYDRINLFSRN